MLTYLGYASIILVVFLTIGIAGYHHWLAGLGWIDALLNASMILTGMGPVDPMQDDTGKLFASLYALYSGVAFLTMRDQRLPGAHPASVDAHPAPGRMMMGTPINPTQRPIKSFRVFPKRKTFAILRYFSIT